MHLARSEQLQWFPALSEDATVSYFSSHWVRAGSRWMPVQKSAEAASGTKSLFSLFVNRFSAPVHQHITIKHCGNNLFLLVALL